MQVLRERVWELRARLRKRSRPPLPVAFHRTT